MQQCLVFFLFYFRFGYGVQGTEYRVLGKLGTECVNILYILIKTGSIHSSITIKTYNQYLT